MFKLTKDKIDDFALSLREDEKADSTVERYSRDLYSLLSWAEVRAPRCEEGGALLDKGVLLDYKKHLCERYAVGSVNSILSSINSFFAYVGCYELHVKSVKIQRKVFLPKERELTRREYERLLDAALKAGNERLYLAMQTICSTGMRISELRFITVDSLASGEAQIRCKGKQRPVFLPTILCKMLKNYCQKQNIEAGAVFVSRNGLALDRSNVWSEMKKLCASARVNPDKVFPHNLRHLFARTYYASSKDIVRLADILGHSSVNTTRIYTMESGDVHKRQIQRLGLVIESGTDTADNT